jgi:hypothetical protein
MDGEKKLPLSHRPRTNGSEIRRKQLRTTVRWSPEEYGTLEEAALGTGLTLGSYIRTCTLKTPTTRARRRPLADVAALSKAMVEFNRFGVNLNQIARHLNSGNAPGAPEAAALCDMRDAVLQTLRAARIALGLQS